MHFSAKDSFVSKALILKFNSIASVMASHLDRLVGGIFGFDDPCLQSNCLACIVELLRAKPELMAQVFELDCLSNLIDALNYEIQHWPRDDTGTLPMAMQV